MRLGVAGAFRMLLLAAVPVGVALRGGDPVARVPFAWTPGQIEVAVQVNGAPATFLLDTGSEYSIVSTRLARQFGLVTTPRGTRDFAGGVTLRIGSLTLEPRRVMVLPFDAYFQRGRPIDGVIGYDLFVQYVVTIDFQKKTLTLSKPAGFVRPAAAVAVPITFAGRLPVVQSTLTLADHSTIEARLVVDTGASQSILLRYPFSRAHGLLDRGGNESAAPSLADGTRRLVEVPVDSASVGEWTFDRPGVRAFTEPIGSAASTDTDGLIGNTLLSRFTPCIDYAGKRLLLQPVRR